ncbi:uncharacterized protein EAF02_003020 [Botrytis sinoallii]|uniref:uncharacterized protein n=1 Tax=Botrytis sinoallii TaxID=1463999 RepID=UPI001901328F|nr:uncharacterized protein EAF02_003020 [Botrytis sinoallii]KAF7888479.1 hypothetical protein EAF02_003020 [Botrytis sinoallii]
MDVNRSIKRIAVLCRRVATKVKTSWLPVNPKTWKMDTEMELILEGKGRDAAVKIVRAGAGEKREGGLTEGMQLESQMKIEAAAQNPLKDV